MSQGILPDRALVAPRPRWFKGNLHCHSYWSDGLAFPDQAVRDYREAGFDFCALTDHNCPDSDPARWRKVEPEEKGWPPAVGRRNFDLYRAEFPHADWREADGATEVRLQTVAELAARYNEPGRFLLMPGAEITRSLTYDRGAYHMHMVYANLAGLPESLADTHDIVQRMPGCADVSAMIRQSRADVAELAARLGSPPHLCVLCHPHWRYYDVVAQDVIDNPEVRFFEVCNKGADFPPFGLLPDDGRYNERLWDAVNAVRAKTGQPLLYALGGDDCHFYPSTRTEHPLCMGEAFVVVRAESLTPAALFSAMERGDFYASCGAMLDDVRFDAGTGELTVSIPAKAGVAHTVAFIATKRDADTDILQTVVLPGKGPLDYSGRPMRKVPVYSRDVGATVKEVRGGKGKALVASYTLAPDDLYVRARVESDEPAPYYAAGNTAPMHPKFATAWTQPYRRTT